jgi:hypothetical protein
LSDVPHRGKRLEHQEASRNREILRRMRRQESDLPDQGRSYQRGLSMIRPVAVVLVLVLAGCSTPSPEITSANASSVTVVANSGFRTGFASEQEIRVTAQRACEAFGRDAGVIIQGSANDNRRTVEFSCVDRASRIAETPES